MPISQLPGGYLPQTSVKERVRVELLLVRKQVSPPFRLTSKYSKYSSQPDQLFAALDDHPLRRIPLLLHDHCLPEPSFLPLQTCASPTGYRPRRHTVFRCVPIVSKAKPYKFEVTRRLALVLRPSALLRDRRNGMHVLGDIFREQPTGAEAICGEYRVKVGFPQWFARKEVLTLS